MNVYESIMQGLNEAAEYEKGNGKARTVTVSVAPLPDIKGSDVKKVRKTLNMSQVRLAAVIGVSVKTVEAWEAGTNLPSGPARRIISMLMADPDLPEKYNILTIKE